MNAETTWFHIFKAMFEDGEVKELGPHAFTIYCAVKSHVNFKNGKAFPSIEHLQNVTGFSKRTVQRGLKTLEDRDLVKKEKVGRSNVYTLREKISIQNEGRPEAVATWDYLPRTVQQAQAELKNFLVDGKHDGTIIHIENLTINMQINNAENCTQKINQVSLEDAASSVSDPKLREIALRIAQKRQAAKGAKDVNVE